jgi:hypothetical protein
VTTPNLPNRPTAPQPAPKPTAPPTRFKAKAASTGPMPEGMHYAVFSTTESVPAREWEGKQLEEGVRWIYEVSVGPHKGRRLYSITGTVPTEKNGCGRIISGMLGPPFKPDEDIDIEPLIGQTFLVNVQGGKVVTVAIPPDVNV